MTDAAPAVQTHGLTKVYTDFFWRPKVLAVDRLDLTVEHGEVFGLLGPNGSGKTTTVKMLLGLLFPTAGSARVLGGEPRASATRARVGYLPEETYLYRFLDADETLTFYGRLFDIPRRELARRVDALVERVGLAHARRRKLGEYSKGMSRRLGIAQALVNEPDLIILDEPTSGLDPIGAREVKDLVLELKTRGRTVLLCSHLMADIEEVCDRIAILHLGVLQRAGRVADLLAHTDERSFRCRGLSDEAAGEVAAAVRARGELLSVEHPRERMEDVFLEVVKARPQAAPPAAEPREER